MAEQIVFTNAIVQTGEKYFSGHGHLGEPSIYGLTTTMTRHAGIRSSYNLRRHGFGPGKQTRRDAACRVSDNIAIADRGGDGASPVSTFGFFTAQMQPFNEHFDVVVVGAGHAGCEAAMASARMGLKTALF